MSFDSLRTSFRPVKPIVRLVLRQQAKTSRLVLALVYLSLSAVLGLVARSVTDPKTATVDIVSQLALSLAVPLISLVLATGTIGSWHRDESLVYLWLRAVRRSTLTISVVAAATALSLVVNLIPVVVLVVLSGQAGGGTLVGSVQSVAWMSITYTSVSTLLGLIVRRPLVVGFAYLLLWESLAATSDALSRFSLQSYGSSILALRSSVDLDTAGQTLWAASVVPIALAVVAVALTSLRLSRLEVA